MQENKNFCINYYTKSSMDWVELGLVLKLDLINLIFSLFHVIGSPVREVN